VEIKEEIEGIKKRLLLIEIEISDSVAYIQDLTSSFHAIARERHQEEIAEHIIRAIHDRDLPEKKEYINAMTDEEYNEWVKKRISGD